MHSLFRSSLFSAVALAAAAQTVPPDHDPVTLSHVVVTAHPYARGQADLAQPTTVLAGRALTLRQAASLGELLAAEPGISSTWFGPGASRPVIRGLGGDRVRVLQNSLGTFDASVTSPDHAVALDPLLIERVEVVRGPASLLHGSSAVGGVVNVITHRIHQTAPKTPLAGRAEARFGTGSDERAGAVLAEGGQGLVAWHVDAYRRVADDVEIPGSAWSEDRLHDDPEHDDGPGDEPDHEEEPEEPPAPGRIPNTALRADGAAAGLSLVGSRGYLGLAFSGHNSLYGVPPGAHDGHAEEDPGEEPEDEHDEEEEEHGDIRIDLRQRRLDTEGEWRMSGGGLRTARFKYAHSEYRHQELEGDELGTVFRSDGREARGELLHEAVGPFTGAIGAQYVRQELAAVGAEAFLPPSRTTQTALFVLEEATTGPVTWQIGGRAESHRIRLLDGSARRREEDTLSVSTGAVWNLTETWTLAASLSRTERPPNAQELFADGPHLGTGAYEIGDAELGAERSLALDVSLRRRTGRITGGVTAFINRFDGYLFEQPTGEERDELAVYQYVQHDARFVGAELEAVVHLHDADEQQVDLTFAADLVRGRNRDSDTDLPRVTPPRVRVGLDWIRDRVWAGVEVQRVLRQDRVAPEESPTDGYTRLAAHAGWRVLAGTTTLDLFVRGSNLLDGEARSHVSFLKDLAPLPGRNVTVGVQASF